ncbi:cytochrome P450 [Biscogniauxia marginata]|nr:cytochrome P450 [Biscogniauxia marginata]
MEIPALNLAAGVAALVLLLYRLSRIGRRPKGYPPGPPTLPLIGNLHQMPKEKGHLQFQKWAEEYGPVYSLILGTTVMIVLSSDKAINDLLDKRSGIYSSRSENYLSQLVSGNSRMLMMEYGETWRKVRGVVHNSLNIKAARAYVPYQDLENKAMLVGFLEKPTLFVDHIRRYTNSLTTQMVFGFRTTSINDPKLKQLYDGFKKFSEVSGSQTAALLDIFPILRYLPDALLPMRKYAKELHRKEYDLYVGHYLDAKRRLREGTAKPCFCVDILRAQEKEQLSDRLAGYTSGSMLEAGSDTTASTLVGFVQALLIFPEVTKAAQAEIDCVCGDRMPDLNDLPDLPYIRGCMKESMRWMPTAILGVPHAVIRDDEYMGYKIPKGVGVLWNVWAVHNDPERHPDPRRFDPNRWAHDTQTSAEAANNRDVSKRDHFVFGAGRRLCQGMHIADRSLFLAMSRLLWAFDFHRPIDEATGKEIVPDMNDLTEGLVVQPNPFEAIIRPRNAFKAARVREEWNNMTELLDDEMQWKTVPEDLVWRDYEPLEAEAKSRV